MNFTIKDIAKGTAIIVIGYVVMIEALKLSLIIHEAMKG